MRTLLILSLAMILSSCEEGERESRDVKHEKSRYEEQHYFKDAVQVDNKHLGPMLYRIENDEAICYQHGEGIWCHWKADGGKPL